MDTLVLWFRSQGGSIDSSSVKFAEIDGQGRGALAEQDLPEGHVLFSIPRTLTLSTRNSSLPRLVGDSLWKKHDLGRGWVGLILCMMWEEAQGFSSKWSGYLATLPVAFDTPMFWNEEDIQELKGAVVVDKIGKEDAEKDYHERLVPCLHARSDIFKPEQLPIFYSLEKYHINGSRILSRSFHVEKAEDEEQNTGHTAAQDEDVDMDMNEAPQFIESGETDNTENTYVEDQEDSDNENEEDVGDVAMVPMADMLNARNGSENAKLFYEKHELRMVTTKAVKAGDQIWNTYGDPPNSDLLRRYGYVDVISLPDGGQGNPADIVELRADLVVDCVSSKSEDMSEKIDWWLDQGGDDTFILDRDLELPGDCISFMRLLELSQDEWNKAKEKGKLPKGKMDPIIASVAADFLTKRLAQYPTTIEEDELLLSPEQIGKLSLNKRNAIIVRLGEKRILNGTLEKMRTLAKGNQGNEKRKAKERDERGGSGKKSKR